MWKWPNLTPRAVITGTLLGVLFGASSIYLVLKVGLTASASIPRPFWGLRSSVHYRCCCRSNDLTILENNIVQTAGSAGESIAFGVGGTMPAAMMLGYQMTWTASCWSRYWQYAGYSDDDSAPPDFLVKMHKQAQVSEGTACAAVCARPRRVARRFDRLPWFAVCVHFTSLRSHRDEVCG